MKNFYILAILTLISSFAFAQKQNNNWYFGFNSGLDFTSSPPTALQSDMIGFEGTATVSDPEGKLLFYTNGLEVWDRNHNLMPNGTDLMGGISSTQAALIVPLPNSNTKYYLFTTEDQGTDGGLNYSIVDLALNGGFGDIVSLTKNSLVTNQTAEKITAVLHANSFDIWIITHRLNSNEFLSYLLTSAGLDTIPIISAIGGFYTSDAHIGPVKASHNGSKIISSATYNGIIEIFDFNPNTGILSNVFNINNLFIEQQFVYGFEFSPNDSLLYMSTAVQGNFLNSLVQINLSTNELTILNTNTEFNYGALQLGLDLKIYMARYGFDFLDVIHQPDISGIGCQYIEADIILVPGTTSALGLHNFVPYSFLLDTNYFPSLGHDTILCNGTSLELSINFPTNCDSITFLWNNDSTNSTIVVYQPGLYWVKAESSCFEIIDTIQVDFLSCLPIVYYDLDSCTAYMHNGTNMDYSEFVPAYPRELGCANITATNIYRSISPENKHSCTMGINGSLAMCIGADTSCIYAAGNQSSLIFEIMIKPHLDSAIMLTGLEFFEKGPIEYNWINGGSGLNNFPDKFGIRILKDGTEIFREEVIETKNEWTLEVFSFINNDAFQFLDSGLLRIEILPYCPIENGGTVSLWDIDEIRLYGGCIKVMDILPIIIGNVLTKDSQPISNAEMRLSENHSFFTFDKIKTNVQGGYLFENLKKDRDYFVSGYKNDDILNGVTTLDIIQIQRHLLGINPFKSFHQYIAADINKSGTVNVVDLLELRKIILGIYSEFPRNTSWRFGSLPQVITDMNISLFQEVGICNNLESDTAILDFVGIKIGDINGDVHLDNYSSKIENRFGNQLNLLINDMELKAESIFSIDIRLENDWNVYGIQFALELENMELISITNSGLPTTTENYSIIDGILRFSWNSNEVFYIPENGVLINLTLKSSFDGFLSSKIKLLDYILKSQAYLEELEPNPLNLIFKASSLKDNKYNFLKIEPNPVISQINIHFYLFHGGKTDIRFFNLEGKLLHSFNKIYSDGEHLETLEVDKLSSLAGVIYCQLITDDCLMIEKLFKTE